MVSRIPGEKTKAYTVVHHDLSQVPIKIEQLNWRKSWIEKDVMLGLKIRSS